MDLLTAIKKNLKKNTQPPVVKRSWEPIIGGMLYPLLPTAIETLAGKDVMTGWVGVATGGLGTMLIGAMADKPGIAAGGLGAALTHVMYVKGNDMVQEFLQRPIFRFDKDTRIGIGDKLPPGMEEATLPDGQKVIAEVEAPPAQVADFNNQPPYTAMADFQANPPNVPLSDFNAMVPEVGGGLSDGMAPGSGWVGFN